MMNQRGYALVLLIFLTLLLMMLGTALVTIAFSDFRISRHLAESERAFFSAEAGVEAALASLPGEHSAINTFTGELVQSEEPVFTVMIEPVVEEEYALRIQSQGSCGNKERTVEVVARYLPFGRNCVIAQSLRLECALIQGNVLTETLTIGPGETCITGDLAFREQLVSMGSIRCEGHYCTMDSGDFPDVDFTLLKEAAAGWTVPDEIYGLYRVGEDPATGCYYVPGNLAIDGGLFTEAMLVVSGSVYIERLPMGRLALLSAGEIFFAKQGDTEGLPECELVAYSGVRIAAGEAGAMSLRGVLMAPVVELREVTVFYSDRALIPYLDLMPQELLQYSPSFAVEWVDTEIRR
jgi:hypothetical protein